MKHRAPIIISPYTEQWAHMFLEELELLRPVLPSHAVLEHIGSTSVPGMPAKPIVDMMLGARALTEIEMLVPHLTRLGYEYMPQHEAEIPDRRFFAKPVTRPRHFHIHGVETGGRFWVEHLRFRDRLRSDPKIAADYALLKQRLAKAYGDDRAGYTSAKGEFIQSALRGSGAGEA